MNEDRIPEVGDAVKARGLEGLFWVSAVAKHTRTVQLRPMGNERFTIEPIAWSEVCYLEPPGERDRQTYSSANLLELAVECYAKYRVQARKAAPGALSGDRPSETAALLNDYDAMVAILKARGAVPSGGERTEAQRMPTPAGVGAAS